MGGPKTMTEAEYEARYTCDSEMRSEFVDGKVIMLGRSETVTHEEVRGFLGSILYLYVRRTGRGSVHGPNLEPDFRQYVRTR